MKYRTDFVTNSSSSSSVVITLESKGKRILTVSYSGEDFGDAEMGSIGDYNELMFNIMRKYQYSLIVENIPYNGRNDGSISYQRPHLAEISGGLGLYLYRDRINEHLVQKPQSDINDNLKKLMDIESMFDQKVNNYEEFCKHPFWNLVGIGQMSEIDKIKEIFEYSGDEVIEYTTQVNPKTLKYKVECSEEDYSDEENEENEDEE